MNRLIRNMAHFGQHVTSRDPELRSKINLTLQRHQVGISYDVP